MTNFTVPMGLTRSVEHSATEPRVGSSNLSGRAAPSEKSPDSSVIPDGSAEEWRAVPETGGLYEASSLGRIRRAAGTWSRDGRSRVLTLRYTHKGYAIVDVTIDGKSLSKSVHRLVAEAFHGPANGRQADHLNGIKADNRPGNLEWVSGAENMRRRAAAARSRSATYQPAAVAA